MKGRRPTIPVAHGAVDADDARTLELARLRARVRELEEALRLRDEFIATVGHELRNPLTPVYFQAKVMLERARAAGEGGSVDGAWLTARLESFSLRLERFLQTLARLIEASRIGGERLALHTERVDLAQVVRDVVEGLERDLVAAQTPVSVIAAGAVEGVWDRVRLEQIVFNLLTNAARYGAGKPVDVTVTAEGPVARLVVRDRGVGIAPEDHRRIFDRFERAATNLHTGGLGLGLWIVQHLVAAMDGTVHVDSALGAGATFTVTLPRGDEGSP